MIYSPKDIVSICRTWFATTSWLIVGFILAVIFYESSEDWSGLGALISGLVAPLAWFWLIWSHNLQRKELALQRVELRLQRESLDKQTKELSFQSSSLEKQVEELGLNREALFKQVEELSLNREVLELQKDALENQVKAQEGSEQALKAQSEAVKKQLEITQQQFQLYYEEAQAKKPLFKLSSIEKFEFEFSSLGGSTKVNRIDLKQFKSQGLDAINFESLVLKEVRLQIRIENIGGGGILKELKLNKSFKVSGFETTIGFGLMKTNNSQHEVIDAVLVELTYKEMSIEKMSFKDKFVFREFAHQFLEEFQFKVRFRAGDMVYAQKYSLVRSNFFDQLLTHKNNHEFKRFEDLDFYLTLNQGYELKLVE